MVEGTIADDASSGDKGESGGVDAKRDREGSGKTEVIVESPESVLLGLISARKVYSIVGFGLSTSGGMSKVIREKDGTRYWIYGWLTVVVVVVVLVWIIQDIVLANWRHRICVWMTEKGNVSRVQKEMKGHTVYRSTGRCKVGRG